jgi:hypothetical protein
MSSQNKKPFSCDFESKRFAFYILGAGFSKPAGLPLANELWAEIRQRGLLMSERAGKFREDLDSFIEYKKKCENLDLTPELVNFEEFISFLDIEHFLGLRGGDTWSSHGNEGQVVVKTLIGELLSAAQPESAKIPEIYFRFAEILRPDDVIMTFNYDLLLERALDAAGIPYRLYPNRHMPDPDIPGKLTVDNREEVLIMKVHGSIDWFDRSDYAILEEERVRNGFPPGGPDILFQHPEEFSASPLIEGSYYPDDPLRHIYRVRDIERFYRNRILFHATPSLLNPSSAKFLYSKMYRDFWSGMGRAGTLNFRMGIIGFSLPEQDNYARQIIYRIVDNYQTAYWEDNPWRHKKAPLVLIDLRKSAEEVEEYQNRYRFVNWDRAVASYNGFNDEALELLRC